ncbi:oxygen-independent coproporphyrinogen-III oxidase-like protein YqeR [Peptococcaceae bacterium CEB3]|nr:oxygen-independent coproporphyrinogen-III oxidase-like protein YqeR [Peptococcaceae bacterium CEB3]
MLSWRYSRSTTRADPMEKGKAREFWQKMRMSSLRKDIPGLGPKRAEPDRRPGLYVHVPFCRRKCDYCAFYSLPAAEPDLIAAYLHGLAEEAELRRQDAPEGVSSLFIGGGTPTVLSEEGLSKLVGILTRSFRPDENCEQSVEANPGTLNLEKLRILRQAGINRLSLGAQSFSDPLLKSLGRVHRAEEIREGVRLARGAGFKNLNLDLMFGLPGQSLGLWQRTVAEAVALAPDHLSIYALTLEEGTPLARRYSAGTAGAPSSPAYVDSTSLPLRSRPPLPDDDQQAEMYDWAVEYLAARGYGRYEVSNFSLPGRECRHNLAVWRGRDYLGLGPGAVSTWRGVRRRNLESVEDYAGYLAQGRNPVEPAGVEVLSPRERRSERLILGLRLREGVSLSAFRGDFGVNLRDIYGEVLARYLRTGVLILTEDSLRLNPAYTFVANAVLKDFV